MINELKELFNYCPHCGGNKLSFLGEKEVLCEHCGFTYFHNMAAAVAIIIEKDNKILFTRRNIQPGKGTLDLPGGFVDPGESAEQAVARELMEELCVKIDEQQLRYLYSIPNQYLFKNVLYHTCDLVFYIKQSIEILRYDVEEVQEVVWIEKKDIRIESIGFDSIKKAIKQFLEKN